MDRERYSKHLTIIGEDGLKKIKSSHAVIVGLGGLGGVVSELLCRYGVGKLTIIDGDKFEITNLNRQLFSTHDSVGKNKAIVARERLMKIDPKIEIVAINRNLDLKEGDENIKNADVIADCLGDLDSKIMLESLVCKFGKPIVHAAVGGQKFFVGTVNHNNNAWIDMFNKEGVEVPKMIDPSTVWQAAAVQAKEIVMVLLGKPALAGRLLECDTSSFFQRILTI